MAIKTDYNFKGIEVKDAIIKVVRLFGSSEEGWNSLVGVYVNTLKEVPNSERTAIEKKLELIEEFNFSVDFIEDERGYKTIYEALMAKYGGVEV